MQRHLAIGLSVAVLAATGRPQAPEVRTTLGLAQRTPEEDVEQKSHLLRRAWLLAGLLEDDRERRRLQGQVADLIREFDHKGVRRAQVLGDMIEDLREFAADFSARQWYDSAETLLRAAELLLPEAAADDLRRLDQRRAELLGTSSPAEPDPNQTLLDWFREPYQPYGEGMSLVDRGIASKRLDELQTRACFSRRDFRGDGRLRIEIGLGHAVDGKAALAWSQTQGQGDLTYYLAELEHEKNGVLLAIVRVQGNETEDLARRMIPVKCPEGFHWHGLEVLLSGHSAIARLDEHKGLASARMQRPNEGAIGFFVSGDSAYRDPVHFRHLTIDGLAPYSTQ